MKWRTCGAPATTYHGPLQLLVSRHANGLPLRMGGRSGFATFERKPTACEASEVYETEAKRQDSHGYTEADRAIGDGVVPLANVGSVVYGKRRTVGGKLECGFRRSFADRFGSKPRREAKKRKQSNDACRRLCNAPKDIAHTVGHDG